MCRVMEYINKDFWVLYLEGCEFYIFFDREEVGVVRWIGIGK